MFNIGQKKLDLDLKFLNFLLLLGPCNSSEKRTRSLVKIFIS